MKALLLSLAVLSLAVFALTPSARAQGSWSTPAYAYARSPDHPTTWVDGATRTHQSLRWNDEKHLLVADVAYSTADYADDAHPTEENSFTLTLPTVRFDAATGKFIADGKTVATLKDGFFGHHVVLSPNVELSVHRHHGVIYGALVPGNSDD
jgi:hypothetical protein